MDKKPQWYLPMHALLKEDLITITTQVNLANYQMLISIKSMAINCSKIKWLPRL